MSRFNRTFSILFLVSMLVFPSITHALTCNGLLPMLSPYRAGHTIVDATAIRTLEGDSPTSAVEFHVSQVFIGELATDTIVVDPYTSFDPLPGTFPIGSRNVFAVGGPGPTGRYGIDNVCSATLAVVGDRVEGLIRGYDCPDHQSAWSVHQCNMPTESMPITEFADLVTNYYAGVQQAVQTCQSHLLPGCEDNTVSFSMEDRRLRLPVVVIEPKQNFLLPPRDDIQLNNIVMELLGGEEGVLQFRLLP